MSVAIDYTGGAFAANKAQGVGTISGSDIDVSSGNYFAYTPTANTTFSFSNPPASGTATGFALALTGANVSSGYDLANASYDSVSFSVATQETSPSGLFFKPDGAKMYVLGTSGDDVNEYSLSTAWDVSSASFTTSFSVASQDTSPLGIYFKPDGTKMYICGYSSDTVHQYSLSTAWDVSSASYDSVGFSVASQDTVPSKLLFGSSGDVMYVIGLINQRIFQYSLSTPWDLSSASYANKSYDYSGFGSQGYGIEITPDGSKLFFMERNSQAVYQLSFSTNYDISTLTSDAVSFTVSSQETSPYGIAFGNGGTKMYIVGVSNDTVYQYTTGTSAPATVSYPSSVDWAGGTAPDAPAVGETDVLVFYTDDGGTNWYGFQAGDAMA